MSDEDDEPVEPLRRQSTGMLLALPAEETEANDEKDGASGHCADLLLVLDDGNEWSTSVDVSYTIEFVKALAREHFAELKEAPALELKLDDRPLLDPMSLIDYGIQADSGNATRLMCSIASAD
mmetsp:Transcript_11001/g.32008  ORF Transcript_11001/g.32008 Transcript_11001/m.32008 type:complete len:123 (+) Transcript_11001:52-420(+)